MSYSCPLLNISIVFPCYNDSSSIEALINSADSFAKSYAHDYEIIVVDDGSSDGSQDLLRKLAAQFSHLRLIFHPRNQGYGAALASGFGAATKDLLFYTDGDGQYHLDDLPKILEKLSSSIDIVNGYKIRRHDSFARIFLGSFYNRFVRFFLKVPIRDVNCDFRLIRRRFYANLHLRCKSGAVCAEIVKKVQLAGARFAECPVNHYPRLNGRSQFFKPKSLLSLAAEILVLIFSNLTGTLRAS